MDLRQDRETERGLMLRSMSQSDRLSAFRIVSTTGECNFPSSDASIQISPSLFDFFVNESNCLATFHASGVQSFAKQLG